MLFLLTITAFSLAVIRLQRYTYYLEWQNKKSHIYKSAIMLRTHGLGDMQDNHGLADVLLAELSAGHQYFQNVG